VKVFDSDFSLKSCVTIITRLPQSKTCITWNLEHLDFFLFSL